MRAWVSPSLQTVSLIISLLLAGCWADDLRLRSAQKISRDAQPSEGNALSSKSVRVSLQTGRSLQGSDSLALVSNINEVVYQLTGCSSGYSLNLTTYSAQNLLLYRYDRNCQIHVQSVRIGSALYTLASGSAFDGQAGASNYFVSGTDHVYLHVISQLPSQLVNSAYAASFILTEMREGTAFAANIYEIGISADVAEISENGGSLATFTIKRASPAQGALVVNLAYEGDATPGLDCNALPLSVTLANGQTTQTFSLQAINDVLPEGIEFIRARVLPGINYIPMDPPAEVKIRDDDVAVITSELATYDFGTRPLQLPHTMSVKLSNTGRAAASSLQVASALSLPFLYPGGYPGDDATCKTVLPAGQSCTLTLAYNPTAAALSTSVVTLSYHDGVAPAQLSFNLRGTGGTGPLITLTTPGDGDFGTASTQQVLSKHILLNNLGTGSATGISGAFSGANFTFFGGSFPGSGGSCTTSLTAGASCTVVLSFQSNAIGFYTGSIKINYLNGTQTRSVAMNLEGSVSSLIAEPMSFTTGKNVDVPVTLSAKGGTGAVDFEVLAPPRFGTLLGTPPNLTYRPLTNFQGLDTFTYRAIDPMGPSETAEVRIRVAPQAVIIAGSTTLKTIESDVVTIMQSLGFGVTITDDNVCQATDTDGRDLLVIGASVGLNRVRNKFLSTRVPIMVWSKNLYNELDLAGSSFSFSTYSGKTIEISDSTHPIAAGFPAGATSVFSSNMTVATMTGTSPNMQTIAVKPATPTQKVLFGYLENSYLPGGTVATGRRLGSFLPASSSTLTTAGRNLVEQSIDWLMQSKNQLFFDTFQRDNSLSLGSNWWEYESTGGAGWQINNNQLQTSTGAALESVKVRFPLQSTGIMTWRFYLDLKTGTASPADYLVSFQLGRCDLMDQASPLTSGAGVNLVWGGPASGLATAETLGYRKGNVTTSLGVVNSRFALVSVDVDISSKTYTVKMPNGSVSPAITFDLSTALDCMRLSSRNVSSQNMLYRGIDQIRIFQGR